MASSLRVTFYVFTVISSMCVSANASSFLFLLPVSSTSHHLFLRPFWEQLIARGHQVTLITGNAEFKMENISIISLDISHDLISDINSRIYTDFGGKPLELLLELEKSYGLRACEALCLNENLKSDVKNGKKYDTVFVTTVVEDCSFQIASLLSDKIVYINFMRHLLPFYAYKLGIGTPYAFYPHVASHLTSTMSFVERVWNSVTIFYHQFLTRDCTREEKLVKSYFPSAPDIDIAFDQVSLIFTNSDNVVSEAVPSMTNVIKIGGMHCQEPKLLPENFEKILSGDNGIILFSLGSVVEMTNAGPNILKAFIDAFAMVNETVIWKTKEKYQNLPLNIKIFSWLPQNDILGHVNVRLFISQVGIFSLQEAIYNAVPMLGIPLIIDQYSNVQRIQELGIGKRLDIFSNLTKEDIYIAIRNVIDDSRFKQKAKYYSAVFKDTYESPVNRAIFWTEWLTRNSDVKQVVHPSAGKINLLKYLLLDSLFFLLSICVLLFVTISVGTKQIYKIIKKYF